MSGAEVTTDDVADGNLSAMRDGSTWLEPGSYRLENLDLTAGTLSIRAGVDENGDDTASLIADAAFPICVQIGERSETVGAANLVDGSFVSGPDHTGMVSLLGRTDDGILFGRLQFDLATPQGDETSFTDGVFRLGER